MKKIFLLISCLALLTACGGEKTDEVDLEGKWVLTNDRGCKGGFIFTGDTVTVVSAGGHTESPKWEKIKGDAYRFDYGITADVYRIKRIGDRLKVQKEGRDWVCEYKREK